MASEPKTLPHRRDYGRGCYRRSIRLAGDAREVCGELADDFHHFGVRLRHDGERVLAIEGEGVRMPWTTCAGALAPLRRLEGARLASSLAALLAHTPARAQCTHLHDLACLAIAHAARLLAGGAPERRYDAELPDRQRGATRAALMRDGEACLRWSLEGSAVVAACPDDFDGVSLVGRAFRERLGALRDPERAEAAFVLRRAVFIGTGRRHDFEAMQRAGQFATVVGAACHTFDPERVDHARKIHGTVRDFTGSPERIFERDAP